MQRKKRVPLYVGRYFLPVFFLSTFFPFWFHNVICSLVMIRNHCFSIFSPSWQVSPCVQHSLDAVKPRESMKFGRMQAFFSLILYPKRNCFLFDCVNRFGWKERLVKPEESGFLLCRIVLQCNTVSNVKLYLFATWAIAATGSLRSSDDVRPYFIHERFVLLNYLHFPLNKIVVFHNIFFLIIL